MVKPVPITCTVEGCDRPYLASGYCNTHYRRIRRSGTLDRTTTADPIKRFWEKVDTSAGPDGCWPWLATITYRGYGHFKLHGHLVVAHRVAYELTVGPVPDQTVLDHLCHTRDKECAGGVACPHRRCVNPDHLEPVTVAENIRRGRMLDLRAKKTHCPAGHEYTPENTYLNKRGARGCRTCVRLAGRARRETQRTYSTAIATDVASSSP
jgi:hypothetical protein